MKKTKIKKEKSNFFDNKYVKIITFVGAIVGAMLSIILTSLEISSFFPKVPALEITPYNNNGTLSYFIYNDGERIAQIFNYTLCWFEDDSNKCWTIFQETNLGRPMDILPKQREILSTDYKINILKSNFINSSTKWATQICEKKIGCKLYVFYGEPLKESNKELTPFSVSVTGTVQVLPRNQS